MCTRAGLEEPSARTKQPSSPRGRLDRVVRLARRDAEALGDELEVVDERLHRGRELVPRRQRVLAVLGDVRALGQALERLLDDPHRLLHLLHADAVAVVVVADRPDRDREVEVVVGGVGLRLAQVPRVAGRAQQRPGDAEVEQRLLVDARRRCAGAAGRSRSCRAGPRTGRRAPGISSQNARSLLGEARPGCPRSRRRPGCSAVCMRWPVDISNRSRIRSRSRKQYQNIEIAPRSSALVPSHTRWDMIRLSSRWITRRYWAALRDLEVEQRLRRRRRTRIALK